MYDVPLSVILYVPSKTMSSSTIIYLYFNFSDGLIVGHTPQLSQFAKSILRVICCCWMAQRPSVIGFDFLNHLNILIFSTATFVVLFCSTDSVIT